MYSECTSIGVSDVLDRSSLSFCLNFVTLECQVINVLQMYLGGSAAITATGELQTMQSNVK